MRLQERVAALVAGGGKDSDAQSDQDARKGGGMRGKAALVFTWQGRHRCAEYQDKRGGFMHACGGSVRVGDEGNGEHLELVRLPR